MHYIAEYSDPSKSIMYAQISTRMVLQHSGINVVGASSSDPDCSSKIDAQSTDNLYMAEASATNLLIMASEKKSRGCQLQDADLKLVGWS